MALSPEDRLGLWANIPRVEAQRMLKKLPFTDAKLKADAIYDLTLLATGSKEEAERAWKQQVHKELASGETPQ